MRRSLRAELKCSDYNLINVKLTLKPYGKLHCSFTCLENLLVLVIVIVVDVSENSVMVAMILLLSLRANR